MSVDQILRETKFEVIKSSVDLRTEPLVNIALVDARNLLRECLSQYMNSYRNFSAVGYATLDDFIVGENGKNNTHVVLYAAAHTDQRLSDNMLRIRDECRRCSIVVLVETFDAQSVRKLLQQGVRAVVPTTFAPKVFLEVISLVLSGGIFVPSDCFIGITQCTSPKPAPSGYGLTNREEEIVSHLRAGKANKQIAFDLGVSLGTVKVHVHNIMKKLDAHSRTQILAHPNLAIANSGRRIGYRQPNPT
jgi:DNA-binding NarL/FixJ family response regulator